MATPEDEETIVVCMPWSAPALFKDDVRATCTGCGQTVRHRPHVPKGAKPLCTDCYADRATPDDEPVITNETVRDVMEYFRNKRH